jgi:DNA adenine methylase
MCESEDAVKSDIANELIDFVKQELGTTRCYKIGIIGGDWYIKSEIIDLLTKSGCKTLVEVFGGGGIVSAFAPRNVFNIIVYNDKDEFVYSFFKVLKEKPGELMRELILMPFSRKMHDELRQTVKTEKYRNMSDIEKAVLFFYLHVTSHAGTVNGGFKVAKNVRTSRSKVYLRKIVSLADIAKKWIDVVLENKDFGEIIALYDSQNTVFYCDPPFPLKDFYRLGFTHRDMKMLLDILAKIRGKFVLKLSEDYLRLSYISEFVAKYMAKTIEHHKVSQKVELGQTKAKQKTVLIYNYMISGWDAGGVKHGDHR